MKKPQVLVCPLDWGLGHATRCVPIIETFLAEGCELTLGGSGIGFEYLKNRFRSLPCISLPSSGIRFGKHPIWQNRSLIIAYKIFRQKKRDFQNLKQYNGLFDIVISDNRYGCHIDGSKNILITHQPNPILPAGWRFIGSKFRSILQKWFNQFDELWIPDVIREPGFAGILSHPAPKQPHCHYIGLLSRIRAFPSCEDKIRWEIAALVSGPEPGRSRFIHILIQWLNKQPGEHIILCGGQIKHLPKELQGISFIDLANEEQIAEVMQYARHIIARSGYSTLMDLLQNRRSALLVPCPGQTEQEYLAKHMANEGLFIQCSEKSLLGLAQYPEDIKISNQAINSGEMLLTDHVRRILKMLNKKK